MTIEKNATLTMVEAIPACNVCKEKGLPNIPALFDCKTIAGPWAFLCLPHYRAIGYGLGMGLGQILMLDA